VTDPTTLPRTPEGYRQAWTLIEQTWAATTLRAAELPEDVLTTRVNGEWSFLETLRHLILATDCWVRRPILGATDYYPGGVPHDEAITEDGIDVSRWGIDLGARPPLSEVLEVRAARIQEVRAVVDGLTPEEIDRVCAQNPAPGHPEVTTWPVGECLDVAIREEWAHHGYVLRDLAALASP
jgi:hypothetical protein